MAENGEGDTAPTPEEQQKAFQEARRMSRSANARHKQAAVDACIDSHAALIECFKEKQAFADCSQLQKEFWECYTKERGFLKSQLTNWFSTKIGLRGKPDESAAADPSAPAKPDK